MDEEVLQKLKTCIENGIELDQHALIRMIQRNITSQVVEDNLKCFEKIEAIKAYKPDILNNTYRIFVKLSERKTLIIGVILNKKCIIKTVFIQSKKIQKKVEKWQRKLR